MALVTCDECEGKVSEKADKCPHCGNPDINKIDSIVENTNQEAKGKQFFTQDGKPRNPYDWELKELGLRPKKKKISIMKVGLILIGLFLFLGAIGNMSTNTDTQSETKKVAIKKNKKVELPKDANQLAKEKAELAEKERKRKLNYTGNFTLGNYTDEFGDKTQERFVGYRGVGKFSNSATEGSSLKFWIAMDSVTDFDISLYEYAGKNPVKDIFGGDEFVIRYRYSDITGQVTCKNYSDRISCGPQNSAKLHAALKEADKVKFSIYNKRTTSSQYFFNVNANGYSNAIRKLSE